MFSFISAVQFTLFAMWFDMECNKELKWVLGVNAGMKRNKHRFSEKSSSKKAVSSASQAEAVLEQDQFKLTRFDYIAAPLLAFMGFFPYMDSN